MIQKTIKKHYHSRRDNTLRRANIRINQFENENRKTTSQFSNIRTFRSRQNYEAYSKKLLLSGDEKISKKTHSSMYRM